MTFEEMIETFQSQKKQLETAIDEGEKQISLMKEHLLKVQGAIEALKLASENVSLPSKTEEETNAENKILSE
jgi:DNA anti-recombination protein RmuC